MMILWAPWTSVSATNPRGISEVHVAPLADLRDHHASAICWCHPTEDDEEPDVWIHHALDGRETYEQGGPLQ